MKVSEELWDAFQRSLSCAVQHDAITDSEADAIEHVFETEAGRN